MQHGYLSRPFSALLISFLFLLGCLSVKQAIAQSASFTLTTTRIASTSAQLNWTAAPSPTTYDVRWRQQGAVNWVTSSDINTNTFVLDNLSDGQAYEWQMRPTASAVWYGNPASFSTTYGCSAPYLYAPYSTSVSAVSVNWSFYNGSSPTSYTIEVKPTEATSWSASSFSTSFSNYTISDLTPGTTYAWRIRASCSPFSGTATFSTASCTLANPQSEPLPTSAYLRWSQVPGATYTLQWRPQGGTWTSVSNVQANHYSSIVEYSLSALTPNTVYEWQVQSVCGTMISAFTAPMSFTANCNTPTSLSVLEAGSARAIVGWSSPYNNYNFAHLIQYRPQSPTNAPWTTTANYYSQSFQTPRFGTSLTNLLSNTVYEVRVQTTCPGSQSSSFTDPPLSFSTTSCTNTATNLYGFNNGLTGYAVGWTADYNHSYAVQFRPMGINSWNQVGPPTYTGNSSTTIQNLFPNTTYEWRVVTYCSPSVSAVSPSASQTFATPACLNNRLNGFYTNDVDFDRAKLFWGELSGGPGQYMVRYKVAGSDAYTTLPQQTAQSVSLTGLSNNTAYEWQVAAICDASATSQTFSAPQTFTTSCRNTAWYLYTQDNRITSVQLRWDNSSSDGNYNRTYVVRYRPQGADWTTQTLSTNNYSVDVSLTGLQTGTTYEWGVARQCSATALSTYTNSLTFSTSCQNSLYGFSTRDITPTKASLSFGDNASRYSYQIRYRATGSTDWITSPTFSYSPYSLTGLTPYTAYEWQAAARCTNNFVSDYSATQTFNSDCFVPTSLNASSGTNTLYLSWNSNNNIPSYTVQYRPQGTTDWTNVTTTSSSYQLTDVIGTYEWRVFSNCGGGLTSAFSAINTASTFCYSPSTPTIASLSSYGAGLSWLGNITGARYTLQWRPSGTSIWNSITDIPQNSYVLTGLVDQTGYEVQVQTQCGNVMSSFSSFASFTASCGLPANLSSVAYNYFTEPGRKFTWTATPNIDYTLRWRRIPADGQSPEEWQVRSDATSGVFFPQFLPGTYEWQIQSTCVNGSKSAFVGGVPFDIQTCPNLAITNYQALSQGNQAVLTYTASARSEVRWRMVGASSWNLLPPKSFGSFTLTNLVENTAYEWQARHLCPDGETAFGPLQTFTATCPPISNPRTACVTPYGATFAWQTPTAGTYEINWRAVGVLTWQSVTTNGSMYTLSNLSTGTNYEWRIRPACSAATNAPFSTPLLFTTQCAAPQGLTMSPGADCLNMTLSWQSLCPASVSYQIRVRSGSSAVWDYYTSSYGGLSLYNGNPGGYYEYQVQANCGGGWASNYSSSYYFTSPACPRSQLCGPATDLTQTVTSNSAMLSWRVSSVSRNFVLRWRPVGGNWTQISVAQTSWQLTGLPTNTLYEWQLRNECAGQNDWGSPSFFRTRCGSLPTEIFNIIAGQDSIRHYFFASPGTVLELRYRTVGGSDWGTSTTTTSPFLLTGLTGGMPYEMQMRSNCGNGSYSAWSPSRYATPTGASPACAQMTTVRTGNWTDPSTWSCNRVPLPTDPVQVLHSVMIPDRGTGRALRVSYGPAGEVRFGTGARLLLGQ